MGIQRFSIPMDKNRIKSRLGCSVCKKKINNDTSIKNSSSKPWIDKRNLENNVFDKKCINCNYNELTPTIKLKTKINECYCNHMEQLKNESFPKLICSKRFKTPHLTDVNETWLNEIIEFRRQNWFDCHADSFIDGFCVQNIIPLNSFNKCKLNNCYHQNNSLSITSTDGNELRNENPIIHMKNTTSVKKHLNVQKKTIVSKFTGKQLNQNAVYKPWIPPSPSSSVYYKY
ncbi:hypothetical protein AGLY_010887 [Aphis glycines]|uniref:Uncharacterized protein n=1 Tax=Aphis glycines TaxID=307491 RepID=A0A6G0TFR1_APHGL|nr:hypothetical protein AGLY_010887 [Aphis glycines]